MNAIATAGNPLGALAAIFPPTELAASAGAASPVFLNLIHALLMSTAGAHPIAEAPMAQASTRVTEFSGSTLVPSVVAASNPSAAPRQLADALIRSMLSTTVAANMSPAGAVEASPVPLGRAEAKPVSRDSAWRGVAGPLQPSLVPAGSAASPVSIGPLPAAAQASSEASKDQVTLASPAAVELSPIQPSSEFSKQTVPVVDVNADPIVAEPTAANTAPFVSGARSPGPQLPVGVVQKTAKNGSRVSADPISTAHLSPAYISPAYKEDAPKTLAAAPPKAITSLPVTPAEATPTHVAPAENSPVTAIPSRTLPTPVKSIEPRLAPAISRDDPGLAFTARLTPVTPEANSQEPAELPEQLEPASVAAIAETPMPEPGATPISLFERTVPDIQEESTSAEPAPAPLAPPQASVIKETQPRAAGTPVAQNSTASPKTVPAPAAPDSPTRIAGIAAASTGEFGRAFVAAAPPSGPATAAASGKADVLVSARDTTRGSAPLSVTPPGVETTPMQTSSVQDVTLRIARPEAPAVDLHVTQRAGEIQVSVRTPDPALQASLRQDLNTLTSSLERAGFRTDTVIPRTEVSSQMDMHDERQAEPGTTGRGGSMDSQDRGSGESEGRGGQRQPPQQNPQDQRTRRWLDELESMP